MKVACLYTVWIMAVAAQGGAVLETRRGKTFTLLEKLYTWNEAQDVCDSIEQKMLIIRNMEESTVFGKIAETWKTDSLLTTDIWTGLYDRQASDASDTQYHWQGDCSPLVNFNLWRANEPNHQDQDFCVRLDKAEYRFRTTTCDTECQVVCQKEEDCQFETLNRRVISETHFNVSIPDVASCQELCLTTDFGDTECVACDYTPILGLCRMALNNSLYIGNEQPATSESTSSSVYIKRCSIGYYNSETLNIVDNSDTKPIDRCPTPTAAASNAGGSTESTASDATPAFVTSSNMATTTNTGISATTTSTSANGATATTPTATTLPPTAAGSINGMPTVTTSANAASAATAITPTATTLPPTAAGSINGIPTVTTSANAASAATAITPTATTLPPTAAGSINGMPTVTTSANAASAATAITPTATTLPPTAAGSINGIPTVTTSANAASAATAITPTATTLPPTAAGSINGMPTVTTSANAASAATAITPTATTLPPTAAGSINGIPTVTTSANAASAATAITPTATTLPPTAAGSINGIPTVTTSANATSAATAITPTATTLPPTAAGSINGMPTVTTSANAASAGTATTPTATTLPPTAAGSINGIPTVTTSANAASAATATTATAATLPPSAASSTTTPADITATSTTTVSPTTTVTTQFVSTSTTTEPAYLNSSETTNTTQRLINDWETCNISREDTNSMCICRRQVLQVFNWKEEHQLLILKKTSLSSYRRSKISVVDERPSAISIGATGTTVIILVILTIASKDVYGCCVWLLQLTKAN